MLFISYFGRANFAKTVPTSKNYITCSKNHDFVAFLCFLDLSLVCFALMITCVILGPPLNKQRALKHARQDMMLDAGRGRINSVGGGGQGAVMVGGQFGGGFRLQKPGAGYLRGGMPASGLDSSDFLCREDSCDQVEETGQMLGPAGVAGPGRYSLAASVGQQEVVSSDDSSAPASPDSCEDRLPPMLA